MPFLWSFFVYGLCYLIKFPYLANLYQLKAASRGATISLVDLRWGITEEDAKSGKVVEICLKEIVNSRPFFIGMVGDRYGWCPSYEDLSQTLNDSLEYRWIEDDLNHHLSLLN